jgi:hypothetical protein
MCPSRYSRFNVMFLKKTHFSFESWWLFRVGRVVFLILGSESGLFRPARPTPKVGCIETPGWPNTCRRQTVRRRSALAGIARIARPLVSDWSAGVWEAHFLLFPTCRVSRRDEMRTRSRLARSHTRSSRFLDSFFSHLGSNSRTMSACTSYHL